MRNTENIRPENRGACAREYAGGNKKEYRKDCRKDYGADYREDYRRIHRKDYGESGRINQENIYRELSKDGQRFCAAAGLVEEVIVLAAFGIRVSVSPLPVLAFLWVLFVILTAAALIGVSWLADCLAGLRPDPQCAPEYRCAKTAPVPRAALGGGRDSKEERIAA